MEIYIFLDTNIIYDDFHFKGFQLNNLLEISKENNFKLKITIFNFEEVIKKYKEQANSIIKVLNANVYDIKKYNLMEYVNFEKIKIKNVVEDYREFLLQFLEDNNIKIVKISEESNAIQNITNKYFNHDKPFDVGKDSFQDAIIWETIKSFSENTSSDDYIFFISKNTKDFTSGEKKELDVILQTEIPNLIYINSLEVFFNHPYIAIEQLSEFEELEPNRQNDIINTFSEYIEVEFEDYLSAYLIQNEFEAEFFSGWGEDLYIQDIEFSLSEILEKEGNLLYINYSSYVHTDFNVTTLNQHYESEYLKENIEVKFYLYGSFAYNLVNNVIEEIEINAN